MAILHAIGGSIQNIGTRSLRETLTRPRGALLAALLEVSLGRLVERRKKLSELSYPAIAVLCLLSNIME